MLFRSEALDGEIGEGIYNPFGANPEANLRNNRIKIGTDFEDHPRILFLSLSELEGIATTAVQR